MRSDYKQQRADTAGASGGMACGYGSSERKQQPRTVPRHKRTITAEAVRAAATAEAWQPVRMAAGDMISRGDHGPATGAAIRNKSARDIEGKARARTYASKPGRSIMKGGQPYAQIHLPSRVCKGKNRRPVFCRAKCKLGRFCKSHGRGTEYTKKRVQKSVTYTNCTESLLIWVV